MLEPVTAQWFGRATWGGVKKKILSMKLVCKGNRRIYTLHCRHHHETHRPNSEKQHKLQRTLDAQDTAIPGVDKKKIPSGKI